LHASLTCEQPIQKLVVLSAQAILVLAAIGHLHRLRKKPTNAARSTAKANTTVAGMIASSMACMSVIALSARGERAANTSGEIRGISVPLRGFRCPSVPLSRQVTHLDQLRKRRFHRHFRNFHAERKLRTASARNLRSYFRAPSETRENADEISISSGSVPGPSSAIREHKGTENRRTAPKTGEKVGDDSPSVRSLEAQDERYDAADDFSRSIDDCYRAVRARVAGGGKGWPR
jgi:hypothetical protein